MSGSRGVQRDRKFLLTTSHSVEGGCASVSVARDRIKAPKIVIYCYDDDSAYFQYCSHLMVTPLKVVAVLVEK
eukprot:jgi/Psemu1/300308/fgenesh1_kg.9_\